MLVLRDDHLKIGDVYVAVDGGTLTLRAAEGSDEVRLDPDGVVLGAGGELEPENVWSEGPPGGSIRGREANIAE